MSAPSKEEIARAVETSRASVAKGQVWFTARIITALADENERLRAEQQRPMPWTEDEVKALIKEAVESDPNGKCLHCGGTFPKTDLYHWRDCIRHTANIEIAKLRAERAEIVELLEEAAEVINTNYNLKPSTRQREADGWWKKWESHLCDDHDAYDCAKCSAKASHELR